MAIESPPCHLADPPHTRLQTHTKGATPKLKPQPKPPGWWLGRFPPTQAPYPMALQRPSHFVWLGGYLWTFAI
ncbi:hypothetical protein HanIR_Chr03g0136491 [Helianthus annuus]|nr:hypothetical protein HanIR_Chr03g0136491 [Helianthus annuus]